MKVRLALSLAILLAGPAVAQKKPPAPPPPADTVRLRFGWPVGLTARVNAHKFRARSADGKADTTNVRLAYRFTVQPHRQGRLVRFHGFEVPGVGVVEEVEDRVAALMPSVIVDTTGVFIAIEGVEAMRRELDTFLGTSAAKADSLRPETRALLERIRSPEMLTALAEYEWNALVGTSGGHQADHDVAQAWEGSGHGTTQVETKTTSYEYIAR